MDELLTPPLCGLSDNGTLTLECCALLTFVKLIRQRCESLRDEHLRA